MGHRRRALGIPPLRPPKRVEWTDEMRERLGREPDAAVAKRLGIGLIAVRAERRRLGVPSAVPPRRKIVRSPRLRSVLARPTREVAAVAGFSANTVRQLRADLGIPPPRRSPHWTAEVLARLGRMPDHELAEELGLKVSTISRKRRDHGIQKRTFRRWTPEEDALVRSLPPAEAAARTGRTPRAVRLRRRTLGLSKGAGDDRRGPARGGL